jgi:hypothetical protein
VASFPSLRAVALKVNLLPFKVNLSASPPVISNVALPALTASVITLLVVTVTNNPDNDGKFHITTADAFSTPENTNKVITLATNNKDPLMLHLFEPRARH